MRLFSFIYGDVVVGCGDGGLYGSIFDKMEKMKII